MTIGKQQQYRLVDGIGRTVRDSNDEILKAAGFETGATSLVEAHVRNGDVITFSQHENGEWDVTVNEDPVTDFDPDSAQDGLAAFLRMLGESLDHCD